MPLDNSKSKKAGNLKKVVLKHLKGDEKEFKSQISDDGKLKKKIKKVMKGKK